MRKTGVRKREIKNRECERDRKRWEIIRRCEKECEHCMQPSNKSTMGMPPSNISTMDITGNHLI